MNKTISITLSGLLFHVEEAAYRKLDAYLQSIRKYFATREEHDEIVTDIEARIAEQFETKISKAKNVITIEDVENLIKTMGTIEDFKKFDAEQDSLPSAHLSPPKKNKKLYRNPDDVIIAGVASGLGIYFGIDPTIIRLLFVLSLIPGGYGIVLYIILWIIIPEARTPLEKSEMRGESMTLSTIEEKFKAPAKDDENTTDSSLKRLMLLPFKMLKAFFNAFKKLIPFVGKLIGLFISFWATIGFFAITFEFLALFLNIGSEYMDIPFREFVTGSNFYIGLFSLYFILLIPLTFISLIGISLLKSKNIFSGKIIATLIAIWMIALMSAGLLGLKISPELKTKIQQYQQTHQTLNRKITTTDFSKLQIIGHYKVAIKKGNVFSINALGSEKELDRIKAVNTAGTLALSHQPREIFCLLCIRTSTPPTITITMPHLEEITGIGDNFIAIEGFDENTIKINLLGDSHIDAKFRAQVLSVSLKGDSVLKLEGQANELKAELMGDPNLDAANFPLKKATLNLYGDSFATINASESLDVKMAGDSTIIYYGQPQIIHKEIRGDGVLQEADRSYEPPLPPTPIKPLPPVKPFDNED